MLPGQLQFEVAPCVEELLLLLELLLLELLLLELLLELLLLLTGQLRSVQTSLNLQA